MEKIKLTKHHLLQAKSDNNGWSNAQWETLGVNVFDKKKGWIQRLLGNEFDKNQIDQFIALKNMHLKKHSKQNIRSIYPKFQRKFNALRNFKPNYPLPRVNQYKHPNWQKMRLLILQRDNYTCKACYSVDDTLHVHHIRYSMDQGAMIWDVPSYYLVTLCELCHAREHSINNFT